MRIDIFNCITMATCHFELIVSVSFYLRFIIMDTLRYTYHDIVKFLIVKEFVFKIIIPEATINYFMKKITGIDILSFKQ